jgi:hypothetical protein
LPIQFGYFPTLFFTIHAVHTGQHFGPVLAFCATGATVNLQHCRQFIFWFIQRGFKLGFVYQANGFIINFFGFFFGGIAPFPELKEYGKILYRRFSRLIEFYPILIYFGVFENFGSPFVVIPETGT